LTPVSAVDPLKLRYVNGTEPGFSRRRCGKGFAYVLPSGAVLRDKATRRRIERLAVPPAWTDVWLCRDARGHIQATGRDARGRKQYVYHSQWRAMRDKTKFDQLEEFAAALPALRRRVDQDLRSSAPEQPAVLAAAVRLLDATGIRAGNMSYFSENGTVGLTTLRDQHADIDGKRITLRFSAKGGQRAKLMLDDRRLARQLLKCEELPGQRLLRYRRDGEVRELDSLELNDYLRDVTGADITAKHFRTWIATVTVVEAWLEAEGAPIGIGEAARRAALKLANTPSVTRQSYIHPRVLGVVTERQASAAELALGAQQQRYMSGAELLCKQLLRSGHMPVRRSGRNRRARVKQKLEGVARIAT
jgi:DNA topoisomerase-1